MAKVDGGELLARTLKNAGVTEVFGLQGGHLDSFLVACDGNDIRLTDTRHEAAAGHAADGYARITGKIGVAVMTAGPGFANGFPSIVNAHLDAVPTLFLVGSAPLREEETYPLQGGLDQVAMATPCTKWSYRITHTERIPELVELAIRKATSGKPGPVLIEIPIDILFASVEEEDVRIAENFYLDTSPAPSPEAVAQIIAELEKATRPVLMIGAGAAFSRCQEELLAFAESTNIPVLRNNKAYGMMPIDHPLDGGSFQTIAAGAMIGLEKPDLILMMGARFGLFTGGRSDIMIPNDTTIVQVNLEASDIGRIRNIKIPVVADVGETLKALNIALRDKALPDWSEYASGLCGMRDAIGLLFAEEPEENNDTVHPFHAVKAIADICPDNTIWIGDGGESSLWIQHTAKTNVPGGLLTHGYLGCLGTSPGFAMGCKRAFPDNPVVIVTGDGSVGFHIQEFETMVRHDLPIITIVLNNQAWGMSWHGQMKMYGKNRTVMTKLDDSNYEQVCTAFGGEGVRANTMAELREAVENALAAGVPTCINVATDPWVVEPTMGMLSGGGAKEEDEKAETAVPYYEAVPD
jgi:acetolactate synthase-1/2/3 large subunit